MLSGRLPRTLSSLGSCPALPECGLRLVVLKSTTCPQTAARSAPAGDPPTGPPRGCRACPRRSGVAGFGSSGGLNPGPLETQLLQRFLRPMQDALQPTPPTQSRSTHSRCLKVLVWSCLGCQTRLRACPRKPDSQLHGPLNWFIFCSSETSPNSGLGERLGFHLWFARDQGRSAVRAESS